MLVAQDITKKFGTCTALNKVSFKVKNGEIVALLGKNGAGKSTLLRIISGFIAADSGKITLDDITLKDSRVGFLSSIGYVPESSSLYPEIKAYDYLKFIADIRGIYSAQVKRKIAEVCEIFGLNEILGQRCETLSKGYKKRLEMAGALLANPKVLLLDEPTEGLDPTQKVSLHNILKKLAKSHIVIISTHLLDDVEAVAERILLLDKGVLINDISVTEFRKISKNNLADSFKIITKG